MITVFSDPHIGCNRTSHTTPASREKLKLALYEQANGLVNRQSYKVCCGDLFDSYWSDAQSILQGLDLFSQTNITLLGNHDFSNRVNSSSAYEFITQIQGELHSDPAFSDVSDMKFQGVEMQWIHHKMTQELFDTSLKLVKPVGGLLFLHCNYDNRLAKDEASLNLTREQAETLLTKVDKIFIGHEHISRVDFDGRLVLTGNTHPTSFSDISDKYVWHVDSNLNITKELIWDAKSNALKLDYTSLFEDIYLDGYQFLEITGVAESSELPRIARAVASLWKTCPDALMIKNSVTTTKQVVEAPKEVSKLDILTRVTNELQDSKLYELWCDYRGRLSETN